ncbi:hypothetical protein H4Q26_014063 [Puccinia striiformis f. sp. tritici PST-130]|nr:hypothetical protein H4Q26_014063 [Puccinia striiformis f. sp. tritici PST-130]
MKLDASDIRYLSSDTFRVLTAVEMGSKNHEIVPTALIANLAGLRSGGVNKCISDLARRGLVKREANAKYDGYRLTYGGYDFLALKTFSKRDTNSFRAIKSKRDYLQNRRNASWMYMSRLAAQKEFAFMKVLYEHGFPVPEPIDQSRHCLVMTLIDAFPLRQIHDLKEPGKLYSELMDLIVKLARVGLIHGDFNEFNILIDTLSCPGKEIPILIDFPQMVSTEHENAEYYFNRDVQCIRSFFLKRFRYQSTLYPKFKTIVREGTREMNLDVEVEASGFGKGESRKLEEYMEVFGIGCDQHDEDEVEEEEEEEEEEDSDRSDNDQEEPEIQSDHKEIESESTPKIDDDLDSDQNSSPATQIKTTKSKNKSKNYHQKLELDQDEIKNIVIKKMNKIKNSNHLKHHSKKSVKISNHSTPIGSKFKNDIKSLCSTEF